MGVNRQFQAKRAKYKNRDISQNINTINVQLQRPLYFILFYRILLPYASANSIRRCPIL